MASPFQLTPIVNAILAFHGGLNGSVYQPTYAATTALDPTQGPIAQVFATSAVGNATLTPASFGAIGQNWTICCVADAGGTRTFTFGTGFRSTGTAAPTASKCIAVEFVSDGASWIELGRSSAAV